MKHDWCTTAFFAGLLLSLGLGANAAADEVTITMAGGKYSPASLRLKAGDTIRFINDDNVDHNVFVPTKGFSVDIGKQEPGKVLTLPVMKVGKFEVECALHEGMTAMVEVSP
jgi:plastocyanin